MKNYLIVNIKYHVEDLMKIEKIDIGDWVDLRAAETVELKAGEFKFISLGVSMKLPEGYEAHIAPRGSTFKNFGLLQTNSVGVVDNTFSGTNDVWKFPAYAVRDTKICINDRICQFRVNKIQPILCFNEVDSLDENNRGGFGSTGIL
jgi:dUTP pyrophosphatase